MARTYLVEAQPWSAATGAAEAVRLAGGGAAPYLHKGSADWLGGVAPSFLVQSALGFDGAFTGGAIPNVSAISFAPALEATRARLARLIWSGAPITISSGDDAAPAPAWAVELAGAIGSYKLSGGAFVFTVADMAGNLAKPLAPDTFAGTGGLEGQTDATGRPKRRSWGAVWNVECRLLDKAYGIYEVGDPARPLQAITAVKDRGRDGPLQLLVWQGTAAATLAALKATAVPKGGAVVAPSIACLRYWTEPGLLTADLLGEIGGGYVETVPAIVAAISAAANGPAVLGLAELVAARPHQAGIHVDAASDTAAAVLDRLLLRASLAWTVAPAGGLEITPIAFADPIATVAAISIEREAAFAPVTKVSLGFRRNHRVHNDGEVSAAIPADTVVYPDGQTVGALQPAEPGATKGAPAGTTVNGRPVEQVTEDLDLNGRNYLSLAALTATRDALMLARTTLEGKAIGTVVATFKGEQADANSATAENFSLLGAKAGDGLSWNLSMDTVMVGPADGGSGASQSMAQRFASISTALGGHTASISDLKTVLIDPAGNVTAKAVLALDVDGKAAGIAFQDNVPCLGHKSKAAGVANVELWYRSNAASLSIAAGAAHLIILRAYK